MIDKYFRVEKRFKIRHQILELLHEKFSKSIDDLTKNRIKLTEEEVSKNSHIPSSKLAEGIGITTNELMNYCAVMFELEEIKYNSPQGFKIIDKGITSFNDKKYLKKGEDLLWKNRERAFNFINKPIVLIVAIVSATIAIYTYKNNKSTQGRLERLEAQLEQIKSMVNAIENNNQTKKLK